MPFRLIRSRNPQVTLDYFPGVRTQESENFVSLDTQDFIFIRDFLLKRSAITLDLEKSYLVETRLQPLAKSEGLTSVHDLVQKMQKTPINGLHQRVVEAMTTHETSFFRDINPFNAFRNTILPELIQARSVTRSLRIWCMACSTGQEPYSLAMSIREYFPQIQSWNISILATDLSTQVLKKASDGCYSQHEINRGLPAPFLLKYFQRNGINWQVSDAIRKMVVFQQMNLIETWPLTQLMDVIFLRNVLIYFDIPTKKQILANTRSVMRPDGYLFLGGSENALMLDDNFQRREVDQTSVYRLRSLASNKK